MDSENVVAEMNVTSVIDKPKKVRTKKRVKEHNCDQDNLIVSGQTPVIDTSGNDVVYNMVTKLRDYGTEYICDDVKICSITSGLNKLTIPLLKSVCREFKLKVMGKKSELVDRIVRNYGMLAAASFLQFKLKRSLAQRWIMLRGPALFDRGCSVNDMDLLGIDIADISLPNFFSFADNGFVYAFEMDTFANLLLKHQEKMGFNRYMSGPKNPYTRDNITVEVLNDYKNLLTLTVLMKRVYQINFNDIESVDDGLDGENSNSVTEIVNVTADVNANTVTVTRTIQNSVVNVVVPATPEEIDYDIRSMFYIIDSYGHYTNPDWVLGMSVSNLKGFIRDMVEIFTYRANLTRQTMMRVVYPSGVLENNSSIRQWLRETSDVNALKYKVATLMKKLVATGMEQSDRDLGTLYVLTALTLNSTNAAIAMPWLYESAV